ncbi:hypothetical protein [Breoghania sp.]|uniref:hypothetical protein n=1 Tax=Breoghania sp. TaxID=2065378 RepID=UPI002612AA60|nr:hypothetical protein [Breoghania sp.]MDJ0930114.1 hypothetical protein [Breoghania sp.]
MPVALSLLALRLVLQLVGYARLIRYPTARPGVDLPSVEDITETARHEIEETFGDEFDANDANGESSR